MPSRLWITVRMTQDITDQRVDDSELNHHQTPTGSHCVLSPGQLKDGCDRPILNVKWLQHILLPGLEYAQLKFTPTWSLSETCYYISAFALEVGSAFAQPHPDTEAGALPSRLCESLCHTPPGRGTQPEFYSRRI